MPSEKIDQIVTSIADLTLLEVADLVKALEQKFGVTAQAQFVPASGPVAPTEAPPVEEEQTEFDVILAGVGEKKIQVIKVVRAVTSLGLQASKDLVDSAPNPVKEKVSKQEAEQVKAQLEEVGAVVELR